MTDSLSQGSVAPPDFFGDSTFFQESNITIQQEEEAFELSGSVGTKKADNKAIDVWKLQEKLWALGVLSKEDYRKEYQLILEKYFSENSEENACEATVIDEAYIPSLIKAISDFQEKFGWGRVDKTGPKTLAKLKEINSKEELEKAVEEYNQIETEKRKKLEQEKKLKEEKEAKKQARIEKFHSKESKSLRQGFAKEIIWRFTNEDVFLYFDDLQEEKLGNSLAKAAVSPFWNIMVQEVLEILDDSDKIEVVYYLVKSLEDEGLKKIPLTLIEELLGILKGSSDVDYKKQADRLVGTINWATEKIDQVMGNAFYKSQSSGTGCKNTCIKMINAFIEATPTKKIDDFTVSGWQNMLSVAIEKNNDLELQKTSDKAIEYLNTELRSGNPVIVGVHHSNNYGYNEGTTDHYVVVVERGEEKEQTYYRFFDPGSADVGTDACNRLYKNSDGTWQGKRPFDDSKTYVLSQVVLFKKDYEKYGNQIEENTKTMKYHTK